MEKLYYEVGKAAFVADRIEEQKGWTLDNDRPKIVRGAQKTAL